MPDNESLLAILMRKDTDRSIRVISRDRLLQLDGEELINAVFKTLLDRMPSATERGRFFSRLASGEFSKEDIYHRVLGVASEDWRAIGGRGWLMNTAAARTLTVGDWLIFSLRFLRPRSRDPVDGREPTPAPRAAP